MTHLRTTTGRALLAAFATVALGAAASAQGFNHEAYLQKLAADAKAKNQTEVFQYSNNSRQFGEIHAAFEKKFGIKVRVTDMFGPPLYARLEAEYSQSKPQADILLSGVSDQIVFYQRGWLETFVPENSKGLDPVLIGKEGKWFSFAVLPMGTIVNTNAVKPEDYPHTWADHVKPRWQGKIAMNNPSASSGLSQGIASSLEHKAFNEDWLRKLAALKPVIAASSMASVQMVGSGQFELAPYVSFNTFADAKKAGAPFAFVAQRDGMVALPAPAGLANKAARAEAAKLLLAYYMTPEAQAMFSRSGQAAVMPGSPGIAGMEKEAKYPIHTMSADYLFTNYQKMLENNKKIFNN